MSIKFAYLTDSVELTDNIGYADLHGETVAKAKCPFCDAFSSFRQIGSSTETDHEYDMVALACNHCSSIISVNIDKSEFYPTPKEEKIGDLPTGIEEYYEESLRCIGANAPNGAATVFRKVIHAVCEYYELTEVDSNGSFYDMIQRLAEEDIITETLRQSLLGVKDAGNDGAHLNENDPSLEQARNMKEMIDAVLTATVIADKKVDALREEHPNPHQE